MTVRGRATGPGAFPSAWRGPLPDPSLKPVELPCDGGYTQLPEALLTAGLPDLGVMAWVVLRQWNDGLEQVVNYRSLADALGMRDVPSKAVDKRFARVIPPMIEAGWIERRRDGANRMHYRALDKGQLDPAKGHRWAVLRRMHDLPLIEAGVLHPKSGQPLQVTVGHLVDFARWQLECRRRGWTAASTSVLAVRWGMSRRTAEMRRDSLAETGLLRITRRAGHPDLVWLGELFDPRWLIPTRPLDQASEPEADSTTLAENGGAAIDPRDQRFAESGGAGHAENGGRPSQKVGGPYKEDLTESLPKEDLTDLGGASATPLALVKRELGDAEPQAAPSRKSNEPQLTVAHSAASRLLGEHRYLVQARPHFRAAMVRRLERAVGAGLDERHLARALARVVDHADRDAHCELVRLAVQQAWADHRSGMCPECASDGRDAGGHAFTCSARRVAADSSGNDPEAIQAAIVESLAGVRRARAGISAAVVTRDEGWASTNGEADRVAIADVLAPILRDVPAAAPDWDTAPDEELVNWLEIVLAQMVAARPTHERVRALERAWARVRSEIPPQRRELLDLAALRLRQRLERPSAHPTRSSSRAS